MKMSRLCTLSITDTRILPIGASAKATALESLQAKLDVCKRNQFCLELRREYMEERMSELMESIESLKISCEESASLPKHRAKVALTSLRDKRIGHQNVLDWTSEL